MKIDISNWKKFKYSDIFDVKKGFYNKKPEPSGLGSIPFLGAVDNNNGVTEYYTYDEINSSSKTGDEHNAPIDQKLFPPNAVCVTNNGSVGYAYYQPTQFTCSHDVNPLYRKDGSFNEYTGLFIASVINFDRYRWGYGRKWRPERMVNSIIMLPVCNVDGVPVLDKEKRYSEEGFIPDWKWMEDYIKSLHYKKLTTDNKVSGELSLESSDWKEFFLHRIFSAEMGNGIDACLTTHDNPKINYVSRDSNGNGVVDVVDEVEGEVPFPAGSMSLALGGSYLGSCFVQLKPFYTAQNVGVLKPRDNVSLPTKLFLATLIRNECKIKYQAFGRELNSHFRKDFTIKLPVKKTGSEYNLDESKTYSDDGYIPDWDWMDKYMRSLPFGDRI